jgi:hypothetical protein
METSQYEAAETLNPTRYDFERPCWKCGATKLDAIDSPRLLYWAVRLCGFQLCTCGGCHRKRILHRSVWAKLD